MSDDVPRRAYRLVLDLEADDYAELLNAIDGISLLLSREPRHDGAEITSGGVASGWHLEITRDARQTPDGYRRELTAWCDERRAARARSSVRHPRPEPSRSASRCDESWPRLPGGNREDAP